MLKNFLLAPIIIQRSICLQKYGEQRRVFVGRWDTWSATQQGLEIFKHETLQIFKITQDLSDLSNKGNMVQLCVDGWLSRIDFTHIGTEIFPGARFDLSFFVLFGGFSQNCRIYVANAIPDHQVPCFTPLLISAKCEWAAPPKKIVGKFFS